MTIGENIKRIRTEHGLSQKKLAEASGVSALCLSEVERGKYEPKVSTLRLIAKALSVRISDLLGEEDWIPVWTEQFPKPGEYVLLSLSNCSLPVIGRYEEDKEGGTFYAGDDDKTLSGIGIFVDAWQPLPERYREEE